MNKRNKHTGNSLHNQVQRSLPMLLAVLIGISAVLPVAAQQNVFTVNSTGDGSDFSAGDGVCEITSGGGDCTLRAAIEEANALANDPSGPDSVAFSIPGAGPHTISPGSALPGITDPIIIDGLTQPGASCTSWPPTLLIELDGTNAGFADGLVLGSGSSGSIIRGLVINRFDFDGIEINNSNDNRIECNFIGTDVTGTSSFTPNNGRGFNITTMSTGNTIGGVTPQSRNLISGNEQEGINFNVSPSNLVRGNYIGTDVTGTAPLGNRVGVNTSGTSTGNDILDNLISGNTDRGVFLAHNILPGSNVRGNLIGTDVTGTLPLPNSNDGILIRSPGNLIGGLMPGTENIIAFNGSQGVRVLDFGEVNTGNAILRNSIFNNGTLGIDLDNIGGAGGNVTLNDPGDGDTGPNNLQNFPVLTSATGDGSSITITGAFNSTPSTNGFRLEFFANAVCNGDPNGTPQAEDHGEGETFIGADSVDTNAGGDATFSFTFNASVADGAFITATATSPDSNTSEFAQCLVAEITAGPHPFVLLADNMVTFSEFRL